ncbi:MAG: toll/interleukin-1 receptor domain-containing protein, partial [Symploca sp. SIO1C4]|nr:toll/interleukin-1 receptor domain-containing protein [Symploca sp. SIO1C4]
MMLNKSIELFFSYAHEDEELRDELAKHLAILKRQKVISTWYDRDISAGDESKQEIEKRLNSADVILLLISADFLASDFCWGIELKRAMERHEAGEARVIPIIVREVDWKGSPFGKLQALPKNAEPVTNWANRDQAFADIARGIRRAVKDLRALPSNPNQNSSFYIERPPIETNCYQTITQPGALLRIKAPQKMGKTFLLEKVLDYGRKQDYQTVKLDLRLAEKNILADYQSFLKSICVEVAESLGLEAQLENYWRELYGLNKNCTRYWQKYLLPSLNKPLVFALDNFERLFAYEELFDNFCSLLRGWYELAKAETKVGLLWQQLRLVVVHSTEVYPKLDTNYSPFNVGVAMELPEFTQQQVAQAATHYPLEGKLSEAGLQELMELVGGHP